MGWDGVGRDMPWQDGEAAGEVGRVERRDVEGCGVVSAMVWRAEVRRGDALRCEALRGES